MLQVALALLLLLFVPACAQRRPIAVRAELCGDLSGDARDPHDFADLGCATQARLRVYPNDTSSKLVDRCVDLGASTRLPDLFASGSDGATPLPLVAADGRARVAVEIGLYTRGSTCPSESPLIAQGLSAFVDLNTLADGTIHVPLAARKACAVTTGQLAIDARYLEDGSSAPVPALTIGEIYPYGAALFTGGACRAPDSFNGELRTFDATQRSDAAGPTNQVRGQLFFDGSGFAGCTVAHVDDGGGGADACLDYDAASQRATMWVLQADHLAKIRANPVLRNNAVNGTLVVRVVDPSNATDPSGKGSFVGARLRFSLKQEQNEAQYVLDSGWTQFATSTTGTTSDGLGVALFVDAPAGPYTVDFGDGTTRTFNAGAAADPHAVTTIVVTR
jgi:hypothetical protein